MISGANTGAAIATSLFDGTGTATSASSQVLFATAGGLASAGAGANSGGGQLVEQLFAQSSNLSASSMQGSGALARAQNAYDSTKADAAGTA